MQKTAPYHTYAVLPNSLPIVIRHGPIAELRCESQVRPATSAKSESAASRVPHRNSRRPITIEKIAPGERRVAEPIPPAPARFGGAPIGNGDCIPVTTSEVPASGN